MVGLFRKKPVAIEARRMTVFNIDELEHWCGGEVRNWHMSAKYRVISIPTLEGVMEARVGDWIIRGVTGEFYPCRDDVFQMTYEPA